MKRVGGRPVVLTRRGELLMQAVVALLVLLALAVNPWTP